MYTKIRKGVSLLVRKLVERRLNKHGYTQSKHIPGFWTHQWRPIHISFVVDDFGFNYQRKEYAKYLMNALKENYEISEDWDGEKYIGLAIY